MADNEKSERKEKEKDQHQDVEELSTWYKKIEMIGIDIKNLDRKNRNRATVVKNNIHESAFYK